jgi:hypothetical protein
MGQGEREEKTKRRLPQGIQDRQQAGQDQKEDGKSKS